MLKSLELAGFKSFADKTRFSFPEGVTVVVGPNGSGKSNVVDGIKWVLGSQSPKQLRGSEMTDVIFSGSASRRAANTAEVTLTFANVEFEGGRRLFDVDEDEVRLGRRVYRSGEAEYQINGRPCRLRDLRELIAGTGFGGETYSIIEQGRVDAMLRASPAQRRALFEEAAGISRFRLKKQEATRRLDRVDQNLLRLSDIVDEVEGRLRRVRKQAGKARQYREQTERLREVRTQLALADWDTMSARCERIESQLRDSETRLATAGEEIERLETARDKHARETEDATRRAREADSHLADLRERIAQAESVAQLERRRLSELEEELAEQRGRDPLEGLAPSDESAEQREEAKARLEEAQQLLRDVEARLRQAEAESNDASRQAEAAAEAFRLANEEHGAAESRARELTAEHHRLEAVAASLQESEAKRRERLEAIRSRLTQAQDELAVARQSEAKGADTSARVRGLLERAQQRLDKSRQRQADDARALAQAEARLTGVEHRTAVLDHERQRLEALGAEIMGLLERTPAERRPTVHGLVAEVLHVDVDLADMVEAALGVSADHVVVEEGDLLVAALEGSGVELSTRAHFQRGDARGAASVIDRVDLSGEPGVMGRADQFVEAPEPLEAMVVALLGRTWFVDTLATAVRLASHAGRGLSFVTHKGERLGADGVLSVGPRGDASGALSRRKELAELHATSERLRGEVASLQSQVAAGERAVAIRHGRAKALGARLDGLASQLAETRQGVGALSERVRRAEEEAAELDGSNAPGDAEERLASLAAEAQEANRIVAAAASQQAEAQQHEAAARRRKSAARDRLAELRIEQTRREHELRLLRAERRNGPSTEELERAKREARQRLDQTLRRATACELAILAAQSTAAPLWIEKERWARVKSADGPLLSRARAEASELSDRLERLRRESERLRAQQQKNELARQQLTLEAQQLCDRMQEDYGVDVAAAAASRPEGSAKPLADADADALRREMETLRRDVNSVGAVNLESLEELDDLESRFSQLSAQYEDLSKAKASLERLTSRINTDSRELFLATIDTVREHFRDLFRRLFGGGEADIVVEDDGADILECGVEITACPPGKDLRSISLLSGGEKTMTCVALLLAMFRSRPAPFCILDEVDAALDEANIGRFTSVLGEFLASTQFIVITHSKRTMVGADTLYGVTMQESGVSKQVSVRFEDVTEDGQIAPAKMLADREETPTIEGPEGVGHDGQSPERRAA
ncbi:Chromosome partition protein Smc [Pseudobythopirellula maris]|uniref:Chromosome partition protein Smc n=1 Tax=Pseudobythopirellula maris TaxID=2527991 RepID=A0A5C5ZN47_9BACT|nr:chromosome segregation protein SMC [Pseudobythopirellula maris]TWT88590.1 Chromosome partition protein Smc [Pseudobythopirellula maris]